jgi:hypothetical protein
VAADFVTASGKQIPGIVGVSTDEDVELGPGSLMFEGQYIFLPFSGSNVDKAERRAVCAALGLRASEVFPLRFTLRVPIEGEAQPRSVQLK